MLGKLVCIKDNLMNTSKDFFSHPIYLSVGHIVQLISFAIVFEFTLFSLCHAFAEFYFLHILGSKVNSVFLFVADHQ